MSVSTFDSDDSNWFCKRYLATQETLRDTLEKYGVAIVPRVLDEDEIETFIDETWDFLEDITKKCPVPIDRDSSETYSTFRGLWAKHSMLIQNWGVGHSQSLWTLRENPKIIELFSELWETDPEDLLVSFDGLSFHIPPELDQNSKRGRGWLIKKKNNPTGWLHTDQGWGKRPPSGNQSFECIQSWVTAHRVSPGDATLKILEKSHRYHEEMGRKFGLVSAKDWHLITPDQLEFYLNRGCREVCIKCPAGSMVFWDSRIIHSGQEPLKGRPNPNFRLVGYLCYTPRELATKANLKKKVQAFQDQRTTSHWPHRLRVFPKLPYTHGVELLPIVPPRKAKIDKLGKRLAGCD